MRVRRPPVCWASNATYKNSPLRPTLVVFHYSPIVYISSSAILKSSHFSISNHAIKPSLTAPSNNVTPSHESHRPTSQCRPPFRPRSRTRSSGSPALRSSCYGGTRRSRSPRLHQPTPPPIMAARQPRLAVAVLRGSAMLARGLPARAAMLAEAEEG